MFTLSLSDIKTGVTYSDKTSVIQALATWLQQDGHVAPGYGDCLLAREAQASTYLGQGVAIPHGIRDGRKLIKHTGIKVMHIPAGVAWGNGHIVYLALGIAADSDTHLGLLQQLARRLQKGGLLEQIMACDNPAAVLALLQAPPEPTVVPQHLPIPIPLTRAHLALQITSSSLAQLVTQAADLLGLEGREKAAFQQSSPLHIGQGWWLCQAEASYPDAAMLTLKTAPDTSQASSVVGLLALQVNGQEHKALLDRLGHWLAAGKGAELAGKASPEEFWAALAQGPESRRTYSEKTLQVYNEHGLHARPSAMLVHTAKSFIADIEVRNLTLDGPWVSAKNLMQIITLGASAGHELVFRANGPDAEQALAALAHSMNENLGESSLAISSESEPTALAASPVLAANISANTRFTGVTASPGLAVGPIFVDLPLEFDYPKQACDAEAELQALSHALTRSRADLAVTETRVTDPYAKELMAMHRELLADTSLTLGVQCRIQRGQSAAAAWWSEIDTLTRQQAANKDALLADRAMDIRDVGHRVMALLCHRQQPQPPSHPYIWVAEEISPSQLVNLDTRQLLGWVSVGGGASSHSAILAAALGIPALVAVDESVLTVPSGTTAILDGATATLCLAPEASLLDQARGWQQQDQQARDKAWEQRHQAATTRDGHLVEVGANVADTREAADVVAVGADGIGLLRTEFAFMARRQLPDVAEQQAMYQTALDALVGRPLVARTLDIGGDKPLLYYPRADEDNPALGVRGIRLCRQQPQWLENQLRALLLAAGKRPLRILLPMVTDIAEWRWAKALFDSIQDEIQAPDVQLGMMVEVPAVALNAEVFAAEVDFFSIGTNDLAQYTLAIDRGNGALAALADGLNPAILKLIKMTVTAAHQQGKWVGLCGELGADPVAVPLLLGLGLDELSVSLKQVALVKSHVRQWRLSDCRALAEQALMATDAAAVRALVMQAKNGVAIAQGEQAGSH
ncbi:PTS fructose transporter subunit FruI [Oceanisphaera marina]|uniref:phosphoenolpyruvate--protein phosphotransferase n=1 Tax=Oceanisphaera marina TaxID=2017550 RepID=A0ABQ1IN58_9GAMM|nr:phosphoenolpyruvate--protein phosphotransferase [Oceanisphaera marina]GGB47477.1 PTS fructose transporter subunit FruI [Oceanisphaera marina]